jgi:hypothetical protein
MLLCLQMVEISLVCARRVEVDNNAEFENELAVYRFVVATKVPLKDARLHDGAALDRGEFRLYASEGYKHIIEQDYDDRNTRSHLP